MLNISPDVIPLIIGITIFAASLISLKIGISVAIIEIMLGTCAGFFGVKSPEWMLYLASFGGILLTFLAGTEIDTRLMKEKFKESFLIGTASFLFPFISAFLYTYYVTHWTFAAALVAGAALSTTSLAVVYSVLVGVVIVSAIIPTFISQQWFMPVEEEDLVEQADDKE